MPMDNYLVQDGRHQPTCSRRKESLQSIKEPPLTASREWGLIIQASFRRLRRAWERSVFRRLTGRG